jgi:biotin operon repressor
MPPARGRPSTVAIHITLNEERQLRQLLRQPSAPSGIVRRARLILARANGQSVTAIATHMEMSRRHVTKWLQRWQTHGLDGLQDTRTLRRSHAPHQTKQDPRQAKMFRK